MDAKNEIIVGKHQYLFYLQNLQKTFRYKQNKNLVVPDNFSIFTFNIIGVRNKTYNYFPTVCFYTPELRVHSHRGLKLDGAIGQRKICNSLKSEKISKSFLSHIGKNKIKF